MIQNISAFIRYFDSIRRRTLLYARAVPVEQINWSPEAGELSFADLLWHLAAAEKMFVGVVATGQWHYPDIERQPGGGIEDILHHLQTCHAEAETALQALDDAILYESRPTLNGPEVKAWRLLLAMVEHEVHHRSQLATYLSLIGVEPPQIYGLKLEDIIEITTAD